MRIFRIRKLADGVEATTIAKRLPSDSEGCRTRAEYQSRGVAPVKRCAGYSPDDTHVRLPV